MKVILADPAHGARTMDVAQPMVRIAVVKPLSVAPTDAPEPSFETIEYRESGLVDEFDTPILTPDGRKDLQWWHMPLKAYWRGRMIKAGVWLSDVEAAHANLDRDRLLREKAYPHLRGAAAPDARVVFRGIAERRRDQAMMATQFDVIGEEQIPVSA